MIAVQPYFVLATYQYHKCLTGQQGIAHYYNYLRDCDELPAVQAIPDGCIDILFERDERGIRAKVCGTVMERTEIDNRHNREYFGIRFLPGWVPVNIDAGMKDLINHQIELSQVIKNKELVRRMEEQKRWEDCLAIFEQDYIKRRQEVNNTGQSGAGIPFAEYVKSQIIKARGNLQIQKLSADTTYSERYINKVFRDSMGMSPKKFEEILKFQNALQQINRHPQERLTEIGLEAGYYDQSHFIRAFKQQIGMTPKQYQRMVREQHYRERMIIENHLR